VGTAPNLETAADVEAATNGKSLVFGQVRWFEDGEQKKIGSGVFTMSLKPQLIRLEDQQRINAEIDEGGNFTWSLAPGTYLINRINYRDPWSGNYFVAPKVAFAVPEGNKSYYVGTLECRFEPKRDLIGGLSGIVQYTVLDESEAAMPVFESRYGESVTSAGNSTMVHDERLPASVDTTAEFNLAMSIINTLLYGASG
jgi:hypothetical protein